MTTSKQRNIETCCSKKGRCQGRPTSDRMQMLARPAARRLRVLWDENRSSLTPDKRDRIKSALEDDYFLSPEQTEQYFQSLQFSKKWPGPPIGPTPPNKAERSEVNEKLHQRQKWLVNFSAQVAYGLCDCISKGPPETLVSNRLRGIADVVLERVAEILGEPKPTRTNPARLPRFMVAISDRIAVWIENAVYRADSAEPMEYESGDEHIKLDTDKKGH